MPIVNRDIVQGSDEWFAAKVGKPSASNANKIITSKGEASKSMQAFAQELAGELYSGKSLNRWEGNQYTDFGKEKEEEARLSYAMLSGYDVDQVAFIEDDSHKYLVSPDGLCGDSGMVEIKNLPKNHIPALMYYHKNKAIPTTYRAQLQMQLLISEREWVDMYYYSSDLPDLLVRVYPDDILQNALKIQLPAVIAERNLVLKALESF